jgi:protein gp37
MAEASKIEWTDATWQPITGCSLVSPGCTNCYAMKLAGTRLKHHPSRAGLTRDTKVGPVWTGEVRFNEQWLTDPLRWRRPRRIFVCAHGDLFHEDAPDEWIDRVFAVMGLADWHTLQVLTKRSARMLAYCNDPKTPDRVDAAMNDLAPAHWCKREFEDAGGWPLPNVWLGVSAEDQQRADERVPDLLATPAAVRFVSAEPLLGPIDFRPYVGRIISDAMGGYEPELLTPHPRLDWVIVGGESGPKARPMQPDWARSIRDQCRAAGVAYFFKQWGEFAPDDPLANRTAMRRVGKARAGRLLDGREWSEMPEQREASHV